MFAHPKLGNEEITLENLNFCSLITPLALRLSPGKGQFSLLDRKVLGLIPAQGSPPYNIALPELPELLYVFIMFIIQCNSLIFRI